MKLNRYLFILFLINASYGLSILFAPQKVAAIQRGIPTLQGFGYILFGIGFSVAALLCFVSLFLWTRTAQHLCPLRLIRQTRMAAQTASLCMACAWLVTSVIAAIAYGASWGGLPILAFILYMQATSISQANLTPAREHYIWDMLRAKAG